jgi:hypothetical protein
MANTEHGAYRFIVKEGDPGSVFIALEPAGTEISSLGKRMLSLWMTGGTTVEEAQSLALLLNRLVKSTALTTL